MKKSLESMLLTFFFGLIWSLNTVTFVSCYSTPKFSGKGDLCGVVVDEKNNPISDFAIYCNVNGTNRNMTYTNDGGIFVFHDMPSGKYTIFGYKNGYAKILDTEYDFFERGNIFCAQVEEINVVLDEVEKMIELKEYKTAKQLLKNVYCERKTNEEKVIDYYWKFISTKSKQEKIEEKAEKKNLKKEAVNESNIKKDNNA